MVVMMMTLLLVTGVSSSQLPPGHGVGGFFDFACSGYKAQSPAAG